MHATQEVEEHAAAIVGGTFEFLPVPGRSFRAGLRRLRVADMVVQHGDSTGHAMLGAMHPGLGTLLLPFHYPQGIGRLNGAEVHHADALLVPGGLEFRGTCSARHEWIALAVPLERMGAWLELASPALTFPAQASVLQVSETAHAELLRICLATADYAERPPDVLSEPGCAENMALSLVDTLIDALATGVTLLPRPRAAREAQRVVRLAEDYLRANIHRPVYREELCAALGVSLRKLHDAFIGVTGLSPQTYLKVRRLALVRGALRRSDAGHALVKSIALSHGFWHLGHFARDYRQLFGETPSETLAGASARAPGGEGRTRRAA
ncbi:helix-turn-helix domain-containing protein [Falsiroseomonas bella]|uniref:helix-turn-helix domain-containing protein n=1 Tax=Falsiroseomonas bella TaxID=2184016 RepID=UPI001304B216|nr:helix-turn-helix domain-containing protein [Falsiroseomonas bella]